MNAVGKIIKVSSQNVATIECDLGKELLPEQATVECVFRDGRLITPEQRKKMYSLFNDIAKEVGETSEKIKLYMKTIYCTEHGIDTFSLSSVDLTTARNFLDWLIEWCLKYDIPLSQNPIEYAPDKRKAEYACIMNHRCCVCGKTPVDLHHIDQIGSERRARANHLGRRVLTLCRVHHNEYHDDRERFMRKYDLIGIEADEKICKEFGLNICAEADG